MCLYLAQNSMNADSNLGSRIEQMHPQLQTLVVMPMDV